MSEAVLRSDASRRAGKLAIYLPDLSGGGAERLHVRLLPAFVAMGYEVTFLLDRTGGELMEPVRAMGGRIVVLGAARQIGALPKLVRFLKDERLDILIANMEHMNVMAILARRLAGVPTRIVVTQHNTLSEQIKRPSWKWRALPWLYERALPSADAVVAVSAGVADDLAETAGLDRSTITVIYNGVVADDFDARAAGRPDHAWYGESQPLVLAMGRFVAQKDFATLLRAFAGVAKRTEARLIILGDGPLRGDLERLTAELGLTDKVSMPGFKEDALAYLKASSLFVLSSKFEGFGNVVAEALACGTAVVSTDCPHGPSEILEGGRLGRLVPVGDPTSLADAIVDALAESPDAAALKARGRVFSVHSCAEAYRKVMR